MGFTLVMPFLPLYFRELGVTDVGDIALWTGISLGVTPAITAFLAPVWGRYADRFGRKIMVERSLISFVIVMTATAYVTRPWHVLVLRAVQGLFAGYGAMALTMAADSVPRERMASSIGLVQTAQRLGPAAGPVVGGIIAPLVGLRAAFLVAASFYAAALVLVVVLYRERAHREEPHVAGGRPGYRSLLRVRNLPLLMTVVFGLQFVDRSFGPILPLYIAALGVELDRVPFVAGLLFSIAAGAAAVGHRVCERLLQRTTGRSLIAASAVVSAACLLIFVAAPALVWIAAATAGFGIAVGVALTAAYAAAGAAFPAQLRATGFGFLSSASLAGLALSPIVSGFLGSVDLRAVFFLNSIAVLALGALVMRTMIDAPGKTESPATEDA